MTTLKEFKSLLKLESDSIIAQMEKGQVPPLTIMRLEEIEEQLEIIGKFEKPDSILKKKLGVTT